MRKIDAIIIHCTDTPDNLPIAGRMNGDFTEKDVEHWHRERAMKEPWDHFIDQNGEPKYIGYHYLIRRNGDIVSCRPEEFIGCHAKGMNKSSLGVCWVGREMIEPQQRASLIHAVASLCVHHGLDSEDVYGHNQFSKKTCPNFNSVFTFESMEDFKQAIKFAIREIK